MRSQLKHCDRACDGYRRKIGSGKEKTGCNKRDLHAISTASK